MVLITATVDSTIVTYSWVTTDSIMTDSTITMDLTELRLENNVGLVEYLGKIFFLTTIIIPG